MAKLTDEEKYHLGTLILEDYHFSRNRLAEVHRQIYYKEVRASELEPARRQLEERLNTTKGLCKKLRLYLPAEANEGEDDVERT